jgi:hypothetical protein
MSPAPWKPLTPLRQLMSAEFHFWAFGLLLELPLSPDFWNQNLENLNSH